MDTIQQKVVERIVSKLKENVALSEDFLRNESTSPIDKKIDDLIEIANGLAENSGTSLEMKGSLSLLLNGLENVRDHYRYFMNTAGRAREDFNTYLYVLETLHNGHDNGEDKPAKPTNQVHTEVKSNNEAKKTTEKSKKTSQVRNEVKSDNEPKSNDEKPANPESVEDNVENPDIKSMTDMDYRDWWKQKKGKESAHEKSRFKLAFHNKT
ncbi:MAG: hypothetical protein ACE5KA_09385 [Nitrososphaerales archaeon]